MLESVKHKEVVEIYGKQYRMSGDSSPDHIRRIASFVDEKMKELSLSNPQLDSTRLAVLSAINIASDYLQLKTDYNELMTLFEEEEVAVH